MAFNEKKPRKKKTMLRDVCKQIMRVKKFRKNEIEIEFKINSFHVYYLFIYCNMIQLFNFIYMHIHFVIYVK